MIKAFIIIYSLYLVVSCNAPEYNQYKEVRFKDSTRVLSIQEKIIYKAIDVGVSSQLALDIANTESRYTSWIISDNEDGSHNYGLFQLQSDIVAYYQMADPLDVEENIDVAFKLLVMYNKQYDGDEDKIKCAWTKGAGRCRK